MVLGGISRSVCFGMFCRGVVGRCEGDVAKTLILLTLLLLGCSHQRSADREGALQAAQFAASQTLDADLTLILRGYVEIGALKCGDTIIAKDSIAMLFIGYHNSICWVRLSDSLRFGERWIKLPNGNHVLPREVLSRPNHNGVWKCETTVW